MLSLVEESLSGEFLPLFRETDMEFDFTIQKIYFTVL